MPDEADLVVHAGDFNREPVLDAFHDVSTELLGVYGNTDDDAVRDRYKSIVLARRVRALVFGRMDVDHRGKRR